MSESWDAAIIGGGLAGGVAAFHLAKQGARVVLFEKDLTPQHRVCGEFISGEGAPLLNEAGVDLQTLGATAIQGFRLHGPSRSGHAVLPRAATGISRKRLDEALLLSAESAGAIIRRGIQIREVKRASGAFHLQSSNGEISARNVIVATGKSEFKSVQTREGRDSEMVGFKMHLKLAPEAHGEIQGHCDLFIFKNGYGGLSPIENGLANFCFLIERQSLREIGGDWKSLSEYIANQNPSASRYLKNAEPRFSQFATVASVPYGFVKNTPAEDGLFCVGDQMAVIPSLTGDGMTIALHTGRLAAQMISEKNGAQKYQATVKRSLQKQVAAGFHMHRLFKSPFLCDRAAQLMRPLPGAFNFIFSKTRYQLLV